MTTIEMSRGWFFVLEGIDGSGKTSVCDQIFTTLLDQGFDVIRLREPTIESKWGKEIRDRSYRGELTPGEELELFLKDRDWHIQNRILPALRENKILLLDRYFFATGAYQSASTGIHWSDILRRNREEISAPEPDIVFILDVPVEIGLSRTQERKGKKNLQFEQPERLMKVRKAYLEMAESDIGSFIVIDSTKSLEQVVEEVLALILHRIREMDV
ncbi:MAG: dTMP kinase [Candidatus Thorarchaeota archaeon]|jgi:dTMP kinase